jgi:CheY-like chemotaxis protein
MEEEAYEIFIIDDNINNLHLLENILTEKGYKVRLAHKGSYALRAIHLLPPTLILLDISMPEMDGFQVCEALKKDSKTLKIPVIFISALDNILDKIKAFRMGGVDYITKPFQAEEVLIRIETQLRLHRLQQKEANYLQEKNQQEEKFKFFYPFFEKMYQKNQSLLQSFSQILPDTFLEKRYRLTHCCGIGFSSLVYDAWDQEKQEELTLKLFIVDPFSQQDFKPLRDPFYSPEAQETLCSSSLPHLFPFRSCGGNLWFQVSKKVKGQSLKKYLESPKKFTPREVLKLLSLLTQCLIPLHEQNYCHKNMIPSNIFVSPDLSLEALLDFGKTSWKHCFSLEFFENLDLQQTPSLLELTSSFFYYPPEYFFEQEEGSASDIYSLGVLAYRLLCQHFPWTGNNGKSELHEWKNALQRLMVFKVESVFPHLPDPLASLINQMLDPLPQNRPKALKILQEIESSLQQLE